MGVTATRAGLLKLAAGLLLAGCGTEPEPPPPPLAGKIVFSSDRANSGGILQLYAMGPDGSAVQMVPPALSGGADQADISPDGERLVFDKGFALYTMHGDGTDLRLVVPPGKGASKPAWSPDGQHLAFAAQQNGILDIWVTDQLGNAQTNLTQTPDYVEGAPAWSPDGETLVYTRYPVDLAVRSQLWTINANGSESRLLVAASDDALNPAYSPDGNWIAYEGGPGYATSIWLVHPDGTGNHSIFAVGDTTAVHDPTWSPDGERIAFSLGLNIATIRADGSDLQMLTDSAINFDPDWGPALPP
jgi:Tol biopolymer transport system component